MEEMPGKLTKIGRFVKANIYEPATKVLATKFYKDMI